MRVLRPLLAVLTVFAIPAAAQDSTRAPANDGWPDLSNFLDKPYGFAPILFPVTEPAVGYGVGGALVFIDKRKGDSVDLRHPRITGVGGFGTEDGSWGVFGGHSGYAFANRLKWRAGGLYTSLFLSFYGLSDDSPLHDAPIDYELTAAGGLLGAQLALGNSNFWAGVDYFIGTADVGISLPAPIPPEIGNFSSSTRLAAIRPSVTFDSRNNVFTPIRGFYGDLSASLFDKAVGSEVSYNSAGLVLLGFLPLRRNLFFGVKGEGTATGSDAPFYLKPFVKLRGVTAQRIQGEQVASTEAELRWQFWNRFSAVGFMGAGGGWSDTDGSAGQSSVIAGGGGFRYEIARRYGLHMGLDIGFGPDDPILYVQFGSAWARP